MNQRIERDELIRKNDELTKGLMIFNTKIKEARKKFEEDLNKIKLMNFHEAFLLIFL